MNDGIGNVNADAAPWLARRSRTAFWIAWVALSAVRLALAATIAPFGDEAWYWQESRALDWAYSDLPPATAWLIRAGETIAGHGVLGMRLPFLVLGALVPLMVVRVARRTFGERAGWRAGLAALGMPLLATLGIFALPDVPLTLASALALDACERAAHTRRLRDWSALGCALAFAWLCHYRAAMLLVAGLVFLCATPRGRSLWRAPGLWLALALSCVGLVPILVFNLAHDWSAVRFQLLERNPWRFQPDALVQPVEQALVCTPLFYLLLLWAAWRSVRRARCGRPWDLFAVCAVTPIVLYFVLGCFADDTRFRVHWPLQGYLPLLVALPALAEDALGQRAHLAIRSAYAMLALGTVVAFAYLATAVVPGGAMALARVKAFPEHFVGWPDAALETRALLDTPAFADDVLVADNFMLAAELDFALDGRRKVYSLDHPLNTKHGRAPQLAAWRRDEAALHALAGAPVLLVAEPTTRRERERAAWMQGLCARIDVRAEAAKLDLYGGRKRYRWYSGTVPRETSGDENRAECTAATGW